MRRAYLTIVLAFCSTFAFSQLSFNARGGFNLTTFTNSNSDKCKISTGFKIGAGLQYDLDNTFALQTALYLSNKGATEEYSKSKFEYDAYYLEIPLLAALKIHLNDKTDFIINGGPYLACGVGGKTDFSETENDVKKTITFDSFGKNGLMKTFDAGLQVGATVDFLRFLGSVNMQWGLLDVLKNENNPRNFVVTISIGYKLSWQ